ncbi:MAG: sugar phosphate isomerase/epimerase [Zestosphaera sp.]
MKLGLNTNVYIDYPLHEVIRRASAMGYEGVDVARTHLCGRYREVSEEDLVRAKGASTYYGISIYNIQGSWGPFLDVEFAKSRIELARKLDCPVVNLGAGLPYGPSDDFDDVLKKTTTLLGELRDNAKSYGIEVAVEPEVRPYLSPQTPIINRYQTYEIILKELPGVWLVLDVEHAIVNHENPNYVIRKYKDYIRVIHLSDTIDGLHLHLVPGRGELDFYSILGSLIDVDYRGFISMEIYPHYREPDKAAYESIIYTQRVIMELSGKA